MRAGPIIELHAAKFFLRMCALKLQYRYPADNVDGEFERYVDVALLLVASHMQIAVVRTQVGHPVNKPGVTVKIEDDRFSFSGQAADYPVGKPCGRSSADCIWNRSTQITQVLFRTTILSPGVVDPWRVAWFRDAAETVVGGNRYWQTRL